MRHIRIASVSAALLLAIGASGYSQERSPGRISEAALAAMGLSGMQPISQAEGHAIRGKGFGKGWSGFNTNLVVTGFNFQSDATIMQGGKKNENYAEFLANDTASAMIRQGGKGNVNESQVNSNFASTAQVKQTGKYNLNRAGVQFNSFTDAVVRQGGVKSDNMALIQANTNSFVKVGQGGYGTYNRAWASNNKGSIIHIMQH